jgi:hypothetical protein
MIAVFTIPLFAQEKDHEVNSEVKELSEFHDVIYQLWHTGWPQKDIELLASLLPDIEKGYEKINKAELPGILRDKKPKWDEGVKKFGDFVIDYKNNSVTKDSVGLLNAAEKLHAQFEALVRIVKPVIKEVDAFHQVLYILYHYYMPNNEYSKIKESVVQLKAKLDDLNKAQLSAKLKPKEESFGKLKMELTVAVNKLNEVVNAGNNRTDIDKAVDGVHSIYQEIEKIFD